jgi:hypothetical protein
VHGENRRWPCWADELTLRPRPDGPFEILEVKRPELQHHVGSRVGIDERSATRTLRGILKFVDRLFSRHGVVYWINSGTLLGQFRHGDLIPWDNDVDVLIPNSEAEKVAGLKEEIAAAGYVYAENRKFGIGYKMYVKSAETPELMAEITNMYPHPVAHPSGGQTTAWKYHPSMQEAVRRRIVAMVERDPHDAIAAHRVRLREKSDVLIDNQYLQEEVFPLRRARLADFEVSAPSQIETMLTRDYGVYGLRHGLISCACQWTEGDHLYKVRVHPGGDPSREDERRSLMTWMKKAFRALPSRRAKAIPDGD